MRISKYNCFLIQENFKILLEANLELLPNMISVLKKMESPVAKFILDLNDKDLETDINKLGLDDEAGNISFYPQKKIDKSGISDIWTVSDSGQCYPHWSSGANYFKIDRLSSDCENGQVGKIVDEKPYNVINTGSTNDAIICHFRTNDGKDYVIVKDGLKNVESYTKYKQSGKSGRVVNKILNLVKQDFTHKDIEKFSNEFKSKTSKDFGFELVSGEDIKYWYLSDRYISGGTLGSSCMRYPSCQGYFGIYTENPNVCNLLILKNQEDPERIEGRALVWTLTNGRVFMDRIYYISDHLVDRFIGYAKSNGWLYKNRQDSGYETTIIDSKDGSEYYSTLEIKLDHPKSYYNEFPYCDTIKFWDRGDDYIISNNSDRYDYAMEDTGGGDGGCEGCGGEGTIECGYCEGSGTLTCSECDGDGDVDCRYCDGDGKLDCDECDSGKIDCDECDSGKVDCGVCDGSGSDEDGEECSDCSGSGKMDCEDCSGSGKKSCEDCGGRGDFDCEDCDGKGKNTCEYCDGNGEEECGQCYGNGRYDCPECS